MSALLKGYAMQQVLAQKPNVFVKVRRSTLLAIKGLGMAYQHDPSFKLEINIGVPIYVALLVLLFPLSAGELALVTGSYLFVLVLELMNTAIERVVDGTGMRNDLMGMSKDVASSAVFLGFLWCFVTVSYVIVTHPHFWFLG